MSANDITESIVNFLGSAQDTASTVEVTAGFGANWPPPGRYEANILAVNYGEGVLRDIPCMTCHAVYSTRVEGDPNYDPEAVLEFAGRELRLVKDYQSVFSGEENKGIRKACEINWQEFIKMHSLIGGVSIEEARSNLQNAVGATQARLAREPSPVGVIIVKHGVGKKGGVFPEERLVDMVTP